MLNITVNEPEGIDYMNYLDRDISKYTIVHPLKACCEYIKIHIKTMKIL